MTKMEHSVDVNANITPVTQKPIVSIDGHDWQKCTTAQLQAQLSVLQDRLIILESMRKTDMITQLQRGLQQLQGLINERTRNEAPIHF